MMDSFPFTHSSFETAYDFIADVLKLSWPLSRFPNESGKFVSPVPEFLG